MNDTAFKTALAELNILMSYESFQLLWHVVDHDLSGELSWEEISAYIFPAIDADLVRASYPCTAYIHTNMYII